MKNDKLFLYIFLFIISISFISCAPPTTTVTDYQRGVDIVHPETQQVKFGEDLEFNFWTYNFSTGATLTNTSLNCTLYMINDRGVNFYRFSNQPGANGLMTYGKGAPLCVNCWTMIMPKENLSTGDYSYQIKCQGSGIGGYTTGFFSVSETGNDINGQHEVFLFSLVFFSILLLVLSFTFKKSWKLKMFFQMMSLSLGLVILNMGKIIGNTFPEIGSIGLTALVIGYVTYSVIILYFLIYYTIEIFNKVKVKRDRVWNPY